MSKVSKTARASVGKAPAAAIQTISDEELIRLLRIDVASGIYPSSQGTHALLRAYDEQARQLVLANSKIDTLNKTVYAQALEIGFTPEALAAAAIPPSQSYQSIQRRTADV